MYRYEIIIWWSDEDQAYVADIPELPGCMAHGGTYEDAIANAKSAMAAWIEVQRGRGMEIPEPKGRLMYA